LLTIPDRILHYLTSDEETEKDAKTNNDYRQGIIQYIKIYTTYIQKYIHLKIYKNIQKYIQYKKYTKKIQKYIQKIYTNKKNYLQDWHIWPGHLVRNCLGGGFTDVPAFVPGHVVLSAELL
jgi:hypothetical protein